MQKVVAFVPAHNEQDIIEQTIMSLVTQTHPVDILVISDNSTDRTVEIVNNLARVYPNIELIETIGNKFKKSGALNTAYEYLGAQLSDYNYVLTMDGDTVLEPTVVEDAMIEFRLDKRLGVVCSRAGVIKQHPTTLLGKYLYHCQYTEYADFDRDRIGQDKRIKVSHGMCSVYSVPTIYNVMRYRIDRGHSRYGVYDVHNITEDYELTVTIKELGYHTTTGFGMKAYTDVPTSLKALWTQRVRWFRGGIDTLKTHGINRVTIYDALDHVMFWCMFTAQLLLIAWTIQEVLRGNFKLNPVIFIILGIMYMNNLYTLRYVQKPCVWDCMIRITYFPNVIYTLLTAAEQLHAYYLAAFRPNQEW